jgi:hypothetical protein
MNAIHFNGGIYEPRPSLESLRVSHRSHWRTLRKEQLGGGRAARAVARLFRMPDARCRARGSSMPASSSRPLRPGWQQPQEPLQHLGSCISIVYYKAGLGSAAGRIDPPALHELVPGGTRHREASENTPGRVLATSLRHALSAAALLVRARHGGHQNRPYSAGAPSGRARSSFLRKQF